MIGLSWYLQMEGQQSIATSENKEDDCTSSWQHWNHSTLPSSQQCNHLDQKIY